MRNRHQHSVGGDFPSLNSQKVFRFPFSVFRLFDSYQVYAVTEGENYTLYPAVVQHMLVEGDNLLRLLILAGNLLDNLAIP